MPPDWTMGKNKAKIQNAIRMHHFRVVNVDFDSAKALTEDFSREMKIDFDYTLGFDEELKRYYSVHFELLVENKACDFRLEVAAVGIFEAEKDISEEDKESYLFRQNSPAMAFPYLRSFIGTFATNCGIQPIILPTYNFAKWFPVIALPSSF